MSSNKALHLSNMYSLEALIDVLVEKGLVFKEEILTRMEKVVEKPKDIPKNKG